MTLHARSGRSLLELVDFGCRHLRLVVAANTACRIAYPHGMTRHSLGDHCPRPDDRTFAKYKLQQDDSTGVDPHRANQQMRAIL
jgi:hypothetical protein